MVVIVVALAAVVAVAVVIALVDESFGKGLSLCLRIVFC